MAKETQLVHEQKTIRGKANGKSNGRTKGGGQQPVTVAEVERKFDIQEGFILPDLRGLPGVGGTGVPVESDLDATYFDTPDLRLLDAGVTLRRRTGGSDAGWHLKLPRRGDRRDEVRVPLGRGVKVPATLAERVQAFTAGESLAPVVRLRTHRTTYPVLDDEGGVLAELARDEVAASILSPDGPDSKVTLWSEVEVELTGGDQHLLDAVGEKLLAAGAEPASAASKLARALARPEVDRGRRERLALPRRTAGFVVLGHLAGHVDRLVAQEPLVRRDAPDAVHQMRVATRRLRSALATFRPLFDRQVTDPLRDELQWLGGVLGAARDAEVVRDHLRAMVAAEPAELVLGPVESRIVTVLNARHRTAHDAVVAELDGARYVALLDALERLLTDPPLTAPARAKRDTVLLPLVAKTYRKVKGLHDQAEAETDPARRELLLHEVRKAAKRARYAGESLTSTYGKPAKAWAERMEAIQEVLGTHQDTVVIRDQLRQLAVSAHLDGENAFTYGLLHGLERCRAADTERQYQQAWAATTGRKLHHWLRP